MIIFFSGTGNSASVAGRLAQDLNDELTMINRAFYDNPRYKGNPRAGRIIWVFPIYSWGVPPVVMSVIERITGLPEHTETWMVATHGDDAGYADKMWRKAVEARGMTPMGAYTLFMPNTYVCMKFFGLDKPDVALNKLINTYNRLPLIARDIAGRRQANEVTRGLMPRLKTNVIYPWFVKNKMDPSQFHATDACNSCGKCVKQCPMANIKLGSDRRPEWSSTCAFCLRCYHQCPKNAVQWGNTTRGKGQYPGPLTINLR